MSPKELKALIKTLRAAGVTHYKTAELEINLAIGSELEKVSKQAKGLPLDAPVEPPKEILHKVEELTSLLKCSDKDLVDRLFPDTFTEAEDAEESSNVN